MATRRLLRICRQRSTGLMRKIGTGPGAMLWIAVGTGRKGLRASTAVSVDSAGAYHASAWRKGPRELLR